jgi:hypothetical protein
MCVFLDWVQAVKVSDGQLNAKSCAIPSGVQSKSDHPHEDMAARSRPNACSALIAQRIKNENKFRLLILTRIC